MNPVVMDLGPLELHAFAAWIAAGVLLSLVILAACATRTDPARLGRWLDAGIAAVVGGVIGARALHVTDQWDYFGQHTGEITDLAAGGLSWHGALAGGLAAALLVGRLRGLRWHEFRAWTDAAALAWPVGLGAGWLACRRNGCAYGCEVRTLADWPGWLVEELPDVYGLSAPRLDLALAGLVIAGLLLVLVCGLTWKGWLVGLRLWPVLALTGLSMALLGFFRMDPATRLLDRRTDQVYDLGLLLGCTVIGSVLWLADRAPRRDAPTPPAEKAPSAARDDIHVEKFKV